MNYGYTKKVTCSFKDAHERVIDALKDEGFGVLTEINVKETLKEKIGVDFDEYLILGACNPTLAHKALQAEREIGLLLPCNVIVYEKDGGVFVSSILPTVSMKEVQNNDLEQTAVTVEAKLKTVIDSVE